MLRFCVLSNCRRVQLLNVAVAWCCLYSDRACHARQQALMPRTKLYLDQAKSKSSHSHQFLAALLAFFVYQEWEARCMLQHQLRSEPKRPSLCSHVLPVCPLVHACDPSAADVGPRRPRRPLGSQWCPPAKYVRSKPAPRERSLSLRPVASTRARGWHDWNCCIHH